MRVIEGDCLSVMPTLEADSIDAIVCDPPYGLKFMGKEWDHGVPGVPFWEAAKRVAKPGAYLLAFGGTRTHHRLACAIEDAGWEIRDCLMWLHGQGFPKGKAQLKPAWEPIIMARKKGTLQPLNIDGCRIDPLLAEPIRIDYKRTTSDSGLEALPGRWPANLILDEESAEMLDEQTGTLQSNSGQPFNRNSDKHRTAYSAFAGRREEDGYYGDAGGASRFFFVSRGQQCDCAKTVVSSSSPSNEPDASAPNDAATSDSREDSPLDQSSLGLESTVNSPDCTQPLRHVSSVANPDSIDTTPTTLTYCGSCGCVLPATDESINPASAEKMEGVNVQVSGTRFWYSAKASRSEREAGLSGLEQRPARTLQDNGGDFRTGSGNERNTKAANHHPTVKPLDLMQWLCRLVTPKGGLILDPFCGSGTTGRAAVAEGFQFIGIEKSPEYAAIARARIAEYAPLFGDVA